MQAVGPGACISRRVHRRRGYVIDQSLWRAHALPRLPNRPLPKEVDVVIVGAGITGLTAAYLLKRSGKRVAVFDRERIGAGETGNTSAHLTYVTDARITDLQKRFGDQGAQLAWRGGAAAIDLIESLAENGINCGFRRVPGFLCAPFTDDGDPDAARTALRDDARVANALGFAAQFTETGPVTGKPAVSFADQGIVHPLEYIAGLALIVDGEGSVVVEEAEVGDVIQDPLAVIVNGETIGCQDLLIATHVPIVGARGLAGATLFQTKLYPYSSYVLGARLRDPALMPGLYFDTSDPYYFLRVHDDAQGRYAIFGGEDHKTGQQSDTNVCFERLTATFQRLVPSAQIERRWSGQVVETDDMLPFIGQVADHQYVATGFAGNGLTFGTLAGMMLHDAVTNAPNPWKALLDPNRKASSLEALSRLVAENIDYPFYLITDRLRSNDKSGVENVPRGQGKVVTVGGRRVAVHRKDNGELIKVSAVCTHMGCLVRWNGAERTWDCPCHGSRFSPDGLVIGGPAEAPLESIDE
jgi:glycine/D-amino acid oxidase-like deaminating enzyme/nitrite reductase/ring-hydroxylating ferredoxin subunit